MKKLFLTLLVLLTAVSGMQAKPSADGLAAIYYAHRDHLGSILSLTDNTGAAVFKASYDVWGKQTVTANTFKFHRGFTGHEHLPEFALINMNGRMYDPVLGRFLSPDPYVQTPDWSQNFNRYSYCGNNPLMYVDEDGEFWHIIIGGFVGGVINWVSNGCKFNAEGAAYFGTGFVAGALTAAFPSAAAWIAGGLSTTNSIMQQGYTNGWNNIDYGQAIFDGIKGGVTSYVGGQFSNYLNDTRLGNWIGNIESPLLRNFVGGEIVGVPFGAVTGGLFEYSNGGNFWHGAWEGTKSAFVSSGISAIGASVQYSLDYKVNMLTGEKTLYRAVSIEELNDIQLNGLRVDPKTGYEAEKLFYENYNDAINNTKAYDAQFNQKSTIIEVKASGRLNIYKNGYMDGYNVIRVNSENLHYLKLHKIK
ncbi:MAG: hypothetical protein LBG80_07970 [Bacteroidales bacterium]|jgi:RHS repeat-associated protein|nr:hypothetical protein [Bacteroidales bacterium]